MRRGLVCIATGQYIGLLDSLIDACDRVNMVDQLFCLTDDPVALRTTMCRRGSIEVLYLPWGSLAWPFPTLWRYHAISMYAGVFRSRTSHLLYCDVDMRPLDGCRELFQHHLIAVTHPGYWSADTVALPLETNPVSEAFVQRHGQVKYVAGGVQGGPVDRFLAAAFEIRERVQQDYVNGVTAVWHDESHWNRYVADHGDEVIILGPEFCWPESWPVPTELSPSRLLALDKDHHRLRGTRPSLRETSRRSLEQLRRGLGTQRLRRARG
jgi:histo-blood group ABO system transferase